jgi:hypothetical protein
MFDGNGYGSKEDAKKKGIYDKIERFVRSLESMGYKINSERGNDKAVLWFGFKNHVVKINSNCEFQWVARLQKNNRDYVTTRPFYTNGIATSSSGNSTSVAVLGSITGMTIEDVSGITVTGGSNIIRYKTPKYVLRTSISEGFVVNFDSNGASRWVGRIDSIGNIGFAIMQDVDVDISGNTYVCGTYNVSTPMIRSFSEFRVVADLSFDTFFLSYGTLSRPSTGPCGFIAKYNSNGIAQCATSIHGGVGTSCSITSIKSDASGFVYVTAATNNVVSNSVAINNFGSAAGNGGDITVSSYGTTQSTQSNDVFLIKYNPSLAVQWVTKVESGTGGTGDDWSYFTALDPVSNFIHMGGYFITNNTSPLVIYNASGVTSGVIEYSQYATLSGAATDATSISNGFLVKYVR